MDNKNKQILKESNNVVSFDDIPRVKITCSFDEYARMNGYISLDEFNNRLKNIDLS